jgi:hypothetical protein
MRSRGLRIAALTCALALAPSLGAAQGTIGDAGPLPPPKGGPRPAPTVEWVEGYALMSRAELRAYRDSLRLAATEAERDVLRLAHRRAMEARAREQGVELGPPHALELGAPMEMHERPSWYWLAPRRD